MKTTYYYGISLKQFDLHAVSIDQPKEKKKYYPQLHA